MVHLFYGFIELIIPFLVEHCVHPIFLSATNLIVHIPGGKDMCRCVYEGTFVALICTCVTWKCGQCLVMYGNQL